jgi:hypothetical protein
MKTKIENVYEKNKFKIVKYIEIKEEENAEVATTEISFKNKQVAKYSKLIANGEDGKVSMWNYKILNFTVLTYSLAENNWYKNNENKKINIFYDNGSFFCYKFAIRLLDK